MRTSLAVSLALACVAGCGAPPQVPARPMAVVPASAATMQKTGIVKWKIYGYKNRATNVQGFTVVGETKQRGAEHAMRLYGLEHGVAVAGLYPAKGRLRVSSKGTVAEQSLGDLNVTRYALLNADLSAFEQTGAVRYDCGGDVATAVGACGLGIASCVGTVTCALGGIACGGAIWNAYQSCSPSDPSQQQQQPQDPSQQQPSDPNQPDPNGTIMAGDPNNPTDPSGDPTMMAGGPSDPNSPSDPSMDPSSSGSDYGDASGYDPNGDFGSGTDYASCDGCDNFGDSGADDGSNDG